jgi:hypothetical protein
MHSWNKNRVYEQATQEEKDYLLSSISDMIKREDTRSVTDTLGILENRYRALHFDEALNSDEVSIDLAITTENVEDIAITHIREGYKDFKEFGNPKVTETLNSVYFNGTDYSIVH